MRFAIRDDDANFFTSPEVLEQCYGGIWDIVPPSLCLISKVKGDWSYWVHQIYKDKQQTDWKAWTADNSIYPIEENKALVSFLKTKIEEGRVDLCYHAKHHRNEDKVLPEESNINYVRGAEYYTTRDLTNDIRNEVEHLNNIFSYNISVFTPPQNLLSFKGYQSVIKAGLNICGGGIAFYKKQKDLDGLINIGKQFYFKLLHKGIDYPYALKFRDHSELPYHYPLQPGTRLEQLISQFERVRRFDGDFVLSTHYVEFDYPMMYDHKKKMKDVLESFLNYIAKYKIEYTNLSELLKN